MPKKRVANKSSWKPGQSGNPTGRPRSDVHIQELARSHAPEAIETLVWVATEGKNEGARVSAAVALLERGYGKPPVTITSDGQLIIKIVKFAELDASTTIEHEAAEAVH